MFESVVEEPPPGYDARMPEWLLSEADMWAPDPPSETDVWAPDPTDEGVPPPSFGTCDPSGWLALELETATADPARLDGPDLIEAIIGFDRLASWAAARQARLLAELARRRPADAVAHVARTAGAAGDYAPDEVGCALHLARGTAAARITLATRLLTVLPDTHALWETGRIDTAKARAIDDATTVLPDEKARIVEARVLPKAPEQTLPQLKAALARAVLTADPDGAEERHKQARHDRRVVVTPDTDGMATLWALLTATDAAGAYTWLTRLARGLGPDDPRTMDTRRADLLAALLNGRLVTHPDDETDPDIGGGTGASKGSAVTVATDTEGGTSATETGTGTGTDLSENGGASTTTAAAGRPIHPVAPGKPLIQIVMAHSTLIGADNQPAHLVGHGPIPATLARETAADGVWRRIITDPLSGTVLDYGRITYHPPTALADHVRVRDLHCRFPGCRRHASDAELDHATPWSDGGHTSAANLHALCLHHHLLKHHAGWIITTHPDGRLTWTTPTGHRHTTAPHDYGPEPPTTAAPPPTPPAGPPAAPPPAPRATPRAGGTTRPTVTTAALIAAWPTQPDPDPDPGPPPF